MAPRTPARATKKSTKAKRAAAGATRTTAAAPKKRPPVERAAASARKAAPKDAATRGVVLLSGGNPQIAKADGDAPVQAYIAALPGWKRAVAARIDALVVQAVPDVQKAVKWNSPLYGVAGRGWFLGMHALTRYLKLNFMRGGALRPPPPGPSKDPNVRYLDVYEDDALDEAQLLRWVKQAAKLPGWQPGKAP